MFSLNNLKHGKGSDECRSKISIHRISAFAIVKSLSSHYEDAGITLRSHMDKGHLNPAADFPNM